MMVRKIVSLVLFVVLSTTLFKANAQVATQADLEQVKKSVAEFEKSWHKKSTENTAFSSEAVLSILDLNKEGLEKVKKYFKSGKFSKAEKHLLTYFKEVKKYNAQAVTTLTDLEKQAASDALIHYFKGNKDAHPVMFRGADIQWTGPAIENGEIVTDNEWQFVFQRLLWWDALAKSYAITGDEKYFIEWRYELVSFAEKNLPFTDDTPYYLRRAMEVFYRCIRMSNVLPYFIKSENFDEKTLRYFLASFNMQANHIPKSYARSGNHLLGELTAVFMNGVNFPELKNADEWVAQASDSIPKRMQLDIYPDGMNRELIFSYHKMYMELYGKAYVLMAQHGLEDKLPSYYYSTLKNMADVYVHQSYPDYTICQFGDAWKYRAVDQIVKEDIGRYYPGLPSFDYITSKGAEGTTPAEKCKAFLPSGFYFMRSQWTPNAVYMGIKNTVGGQWHSQIDSGTFGLYAYGRNFMNDSGSYVYGSDDKEEQYWRNWFRSSKAHQTVTLDDKDFDLNPKHLLWETQENITVLSFENQAYPNLKTTRTVLFVDNKYFLIFDEAEGKAQGKVKANFQLVPSKVVMDENNLSVATQYESGANLIVKEFNQSKKTQLQKEEGWISYKILDKVERPAWSYGVTKDVNEEKVEFLTALVPYRENAKPTEIKAERNITDFGIEYTLKVDNTVYLITIDKHNKVSLQKDFIGKKEMITIH